MKKQKGLWIDAEILHDNNLTMKEKLILAEIHQLTELDKGCFAMNAHFHKVLTGDTEATTTQKSAIGEHINNLKKKKYIKIKTFDRNHRRTIQIYYQENLESYQENLDSLSRKSGESKESNTISNTISSAKAVKEDITYTILEDKISNSPQTKFKNEHRARKGLEPTFRKVTEQDPIKAIHYFKDRAMELHGVDFSTLAVPSGKMLAGFKRQTKYGDIKTLVDWWLNGGGEYAQYTPDAFVSESTINKFTADNAKKQIKDTF